MIRVLRKQREKERVGGFTVVFMACYFVSSVYFLMA